MVESTKFSHGIALHWSLVEKTEKDRKWNLLFDVDLTTFQSRISLCAANATELNSREKLSAINFLFHLASMTEKGGSTPVLKINDR